MSKYERECFEYCLDVDKENIWRQAQQMKEGGSTDQEIKAFVLLNIEDKNELKRGYGSIFDGVECFEFCLDVDKDKQWREAQRMRQAGSTDEQIKALGLLNFDENNELKMGFGRVFDGVECYEYCLMLPQTSSNCQERPSFIYGEFGDSSSWVGLYRKLPYREVSSFSFWRGNMATGVRGIIDPFDPDNPYGPKSAQEFSDFNTPKKTSKV